MIGQYEFLSGKVGVSEKNLHYLQVMFFFLRKPGLSERNPHYLRAQILWVYLKNCLDERMFTPVGEGGSGRKASATEDSILVGLALKLASLCSIFSIVEKDLDVLLYFGIFVFVAWKYTFGWCQPKWEGLAESLVEIDQNGWSLVSDEVFFDKTCAISRNKMPKSP